MCEKLAGANFGTRCKLLEPDIIFTFKDIIIIL